MAAVVSINGIDEAIKNLDYKAKDSPKLRLLQAIRAHYPDERALTDVQAIDPDTLAGAVWDMAFDRNRLRSRRKNLASLRSSVNLDLKVLFEKGKNPDGIIIGPSNTFVLSDEAKDQMLTNVAASVRREGPVSLGQITRTLSEIEDLLAQTEQFSKAGDDNPESGILRLKRIIEQISKRIDLHMGDGSTQHGTLDGSGHGPHPNETHDSGSASGSSSGSAEDPSPLDIEESGGSGAGLAGDGMGPGDRGPEPGGAGEDDLIPEELTAEKVELDGVDVIDEPEELEVVDETDDPGVSDNLTAEGLGGSAEGDEQGTGLGSSQGTVEVEGLGVDPYGDSFGRGHGHSGASGQDGADLEGIGGGSGSQGSSENRDRGPHEGAGGAEAGHDDNGSGAEARGYDSTVFMDGDTPPEAVAAEQVQFDEVEVIDEPENLEIVDEINDPGISDNLTGEGLGGKTEADEKGAGYGERKSFPADVKGRGLGTQNETGSEGDAGPGNTGAAGQTGLSVEGGSGGDLTGSGEPEVAPGGDLEGTEIALSGYEMEDTGPGPGKGGDGAGEAALQPEEESDFLAEETVAVEEAFEEVDEAIVEDESPDEDEIPISGDGSLGPGDGSHPLADGRGKSVPTALGLETGAGSDPVPPGGPAQSDIVNAGSQRNGGSGHGDLQDMDHGADIEELDLDEIIEEDPDVEAVEEAEPAGSGKGEGFESGTGLGTGAETAGGRGMDHGEAPEMGLPVGSLGLDPLEETYNASGALKGTDHKLLAEAFDGYLGAMERFYNQYILIPKGTYTLGGGPTPQGLPESRIRLPDFYMGKFPITNALFEIFVEKTGYRTTAEKEGYGLVYYARRKKEVDSKTGRERVIWNASLVSQRVEGACWYQPSGPGSTLHRKRSHPVVQVSLEDASAFAAWTGKKLPSEAEWEAAARSRDGHPYPWGDAWIDGCCNVEETQFGDTTPVDAYLEAEGSLGIADAIGNVMEWTLDRTQIGENHDRACYIVKGGSWASTSDICLCSRFKMEPDARSNILGFRCVAF